MPSLRIFGTTSRLDCSRQLSCVAPPPNHWRCETWWWSEHVEKVIAAKGKAFKAWRTGKVTRALYRAAKHIARHAVHHACEGLREY